MTISKALHLLQAEALQLPHPTQEVAYLMLDTRQLPLPGALFFALVGQRHNGHHFIQDAYQNGVRQFVVSQMPDLGGLEGANVLLVANTLDALQQLAKAHREQFRIPVVGITGSNGKTIVKEWLYQLVSPLQQVVRSPKSYNSQVGVPLSVWEMNAEHRLAIFEAGISKPAEMARLAAIIQPDLGIFTNLGTAHSDGFMSDLDKAKEKIQLFGTCRQLVYCTDHPLVASVVEAWHQSHTQTELWSWSAQNHPAKVQVTLEKAPNQTRLHLQWDGQTLAADLFFTDAASIENALHCAVAALALEVPPAAIVNGLAHLQPIAMRLELKSGIEDCTLINDFYNNDLSSLDILLQYAHRQSKGQKRTLILSDIFQSGQPPQVLYGQVAALLKEVDRFIGIGADITAIKPFLEAKNIEAHFFADTNLFLANVQRFAWRGHLVLLKGARTFEFERIAERLEKKAHQTRLEINLNALIHNLQVYNSLLQSGTKIMAMVKAAAYGSGGAEVGRLLEYHKVGYLGVAYADEGIELRQAGVQLPIMVLNPDTAGFDVFYRYRLEPEIFSLPILQRLVDYAGHDKRMAIHIKLDTGMHRLGFETADLPELLNTLRAYPNLQVASVFSHLAASDNPVFDPFTHQQAARFQDMYQVIASGLDYRPLRHLANTGGISRHPQYHFEMVRLGIGLYGIDGTGLQDRLQVVNVLKTTISQVKNIPPGESVGYNRNSGILQQPTTVATISIGYADGFLRGAGVGKYKVLVNNKLAPTIGNVCMDMTMIDVSHIPNVKAGDEVVIFGENPPVEDLAKCLNTIPYEIFTNISERVKRVYVQE